MFLKNYHLMFFSSLILGTMIAISSNSWFTCWLGLEINLMSMIPLILIKLNKNFTEASIKYFLAQALASMVLIFALTVNFFFTEILILEVTEIFMVSALSLKGGLAPFHFWFPQISNFLNWTQCLVIFTWQKIAPLLLMISLNIKSIFLISILSAITGAMGGLNQNLAKILMTYSSVAHSGWMLLGCSLSVSYWMNYFFVYTFLSLVILIFLYKNQIFKTNQIFNSSDSNFNKNILVMNFLSLGGLPPFMGFFAKILILLISIKMNMLIILVPLILSSLTSLFFYTRMIYSSLMSFSKSNFEKTKINKTPKNFFYSMSIIFNMLFPLTILLT
uniref:NADH-ubiquinone oxidoreductase chain 2 n=1 Tax=Homidia socia TaxID=301514 RepID=A0A6G6A5M6_9HEXA|nr:NADH dehydrogenase subunit 2 [Homidia socia]